MGHAPALVSRARHEWDRISSTYWFVPTVMMAGAAGLALGMVWADLTVVGSPGDTAIWLYTGGAEGARSMLSIVAGSVITVAGVGFSITIVTLTQASSQFGPRLLRTFMRDRGNQLVLGPPPARAPSAERGGRASARSLSSSPGQHRFPG